MSEKLTSLLAACAITFVVFAATAPAAAQSRPIIVTGTDNDVPVRYVSYRDLNLAMTGDEQILVKRVRSATADVCVESVSNLTTRGFEYMTCRSHAWRGAAPQIDRRPARAADRYQWLERDCPGRNQHQRPVV